MVEIAIALAVIGFALVAIIGVLPLGMNVQRENREETIINQDASVFIDALRGGARGLDDLTNYVVAITNVWTEFTGNSNRVASGVNVYTNKGSQVTQTYGPQSVAGTWSLANGLRVVGLLSTPRYTVSPNTNTANFYSNHIVAQVRALSGAVTEKYPQTNADLLNLAFAYRLTPGISPVTTIETNFVYARLYDTNLHELRLAFRWPVLPNGLLGNGRQTFRTLAGGHFVQTNDNNQPLYFLQPSTFAMPQ